MLNKEMLLTSAQETEVKITLEVYHRGGDQEDVQMYYNYTDSGLIVSVPLRPPVPIGKTVTYYITLPKNIEVSFTGGTNDLEGITVIPSDAAIVTGMDHGAPLRILDNCTISGYVYTY